MIYFVNHNLIQIKFISFFVPLIFPKESDPLYYSEHTY